MPVPPSIFAVDSSSGKVGRTASSMLAPGSRRAPTSATSATQARVAATPRYIFRLTTISGGSTVILLASRSSGECAGEDPPDVLAVVRAHPATANSLSAPAFLSRCLHQNGYVDEVPQLGSPGVDTLQDVVGGWG